MGALTLRGVTKVFADGVKAVQDLTLALKDGELMVLVGPSGCGKSTALRMVAGLEDITDGVIELDGHILNQVAPRERNVAMVFQNYALYPHLSVYHNMSFPLRERGMAKSERDRQVRAVASKLGLDNVLSKKPGQLSGGQRQRAAMGRAIVREPSLFLMDEPLSNLDAYLRADMRVEIHALQRQLRITTMYVTHDQVEAMTLGDRIAVMRDGILQQVGTPDEVYGAPTNVFVATFVGSPAMNLFRGHLTMVASDVAVRVDGAVLRLDSMELAGQPRIRDYVDREVILGVRPESVAVCDAAPEPRSIPAIAELEEALGSSTLAYFAVHGLCGPAGLVGRPNRGGDGSGSEVSGGRGTRAIGRFAPGTRFEAGERVQLMFRPGSMRFFDAESGTSL